MSLVEILLLAILILLCILLIILYFAITYIYEKLTKQISLMIRTNASLDKLIDETEEITDQFHKYEGGKLDGRR